MMDVEEEEGEVPIQSARYLGTTRATRRYNTSFLCRLFYHYRAHIVPVLQSIDDTVEMMGTGPDPNRVEAYVVKHWVPPTSRPQLRTSVLRAEVGIFLAYRIKTTLTTASLGPAAAVTDPRHKNATLMRFLAFLNRAPESCKIVCQLTPNEEYTAFVSGLGDFLDKFHMAQLTPQQIGDAVDSELFGFVSSLQCD